VTKLIEIGTALRVPASVRTFGFTLACATAACITIAGSARAQDPRLGFGREAVQLPAAGSLSLEVEPLPVDPAVTVGVLPNGLHYYLRANKKPEQRAELRLVVNAGSILEDDDQRGLAHFLEHMAFNGTKHFAKNELIEYLQSVGMRFGGDLNAGTNYDETVYQLTIPTDTVRVVAKALQILDDWAHGVTIAPKAVEEERGVVLEEWRARRGAGARIAERHDSLLYRGSRYADRIPIGLRTRIETARRDEIARFYHDWYRPDLMAVVVVGDFDKAQMESMIRTQFADIPPAAADARARVNAEIPANTDPIVSVVADPEATSSSVQLLLKYPRGEAGTVAAYRRGLVSNIYHSLLNQRLSEIAQRANPPFLGAQGGMGELGRTTSFFSLAANVKDNGIEAGLGAMLTEVERIVQHGFTESEFDRQKKSILRSLESAYAARAATRSVSYANRYVSNFLTGTSIESVEQSVELARKLLPGITLDEVGQLAKSWRSNAMSASGEQTRVGNLVFLVSVPDKPQVKIPTREMLLAVFDSTLGTLKASSRPLEPYKEKVSTTPLIAKLPTPAKVVHDSVLSAVGVREWRLANGVRVLLKPTEFNADQLFVRGYSPGGNSLAPDSDYVSTRLATEVLAIGGLGDYDRVELQKKLAGTRVSVGVSIDQLNEGLEASGSPKDAETMFQLLYLQFTAPRLDSTALAAFEAAARTNLANRAASPAAAYQDSMRAVLSQHNPLARPITVAMIDSIDAARSLAFVHDRFADASDFTFVIVGAFTPDSIKPLVERYLGGLPSIGRKEKGRDLGIRPPTGVVRKMVYAGTEPKSETRLFFNGPAEFSPETDYLLGSLSDLLELRLTQKLREQLGGTYGVNVGASLSREPAGNYQLAIAFGSAPERVGELTKAVFDVIESVKKDGPTAAELHEVTETQRRSRETGLLQNQFWLSAISSYDQNDWKLNGLLSLDDAIKGLTPAKIKRAATKYFDAKNYVQVTLSPTTAAKTAVKKAAK
jgi:zinc protease